MSTRDEFGGTDIMLSFRDFDFQPAKPADEVVFAHVLCTNRALSSELSSYAMLHTDVSLPVKSIATLKKPTRPVAPPLGGQALWRLVSHLSLNYLSFSEVKDSLIALREILTLYTFSDSPAVRHQIHGIREMDVRRIVRPLTTDGWRAFCRGTEVTLTLEPSSYTGSSAFLLASVLNHFFALHASMNSFTQLVIRREGREEGWKTWPPMPGAKAVL
jgi:type VI secretion system protein ImpG